MATATIRDATADDTAAIVALALRAWRPVFESFRTVLGEATYATLYPDWVRQQSEAVTAAVEANPTWVAVVGDRVAGFVNVVFTERAGFAPFAQVLYTKVL